MNDTLTAIDGLKVGHWSDPVAKTGCTVVLCPGEGCRASGLVLGSAPASRETDLLAPDKWVGRVDALLLTGGSAFGLAAADGVMRWLEAHDRGYRTRAGRVPIVPSAALFDLAIGRADVRPDADSGWAAAESASGAPVEQGRVGVGCGATIGTVGGEAPSPGGVGSALIERHGFRVAALAVSNAFGSLFDPSSGEVVAGPAHHDLDWLQRGRPGSNTTLAAVATDAALDRGSLQSLALAAHIGIARVTRPSHTPGDGDIAFVLSTGTGPELPVGALISLSVAVQEVVASALLRGARIAAAHP